MTNEEINTLAYEKDLACYGVLGCARALLNLHKSGESSQDLPWETLEKYIGEFELLEKRFKSVLNNEVAA